jgi:hypothetical protein
MKIMVGLQSMWDCQETQAELESGLATEIEFYVLMGNGF